MGIATSQAGGTTPQTWTFITGASTVDINGVAFSTKEATVRNYANNDHQIVVEIDGNVYYFSALYDTFIIDSVEFDPNGNREALKTELTASVFTLITDAGAPALASVLAQGYVANSPIDVYAGDPNFNDAVVDMVLNEGGFSILAQDNGAANHRVLSISALGITANDNNRGNCSVVYVHTSDNYADDAAAAAAGIEVGQCYHTSGVIKIRLV